MTEQEIISLVSKLIQESSPDKLQTFQDYYPFVVVILLTYMLGRVTNMHNALLSYFAEVKGWLQKIYEKMK